MCKINDWNKIEIFKNVKNKIAGKNQGKNWGSIIKKEIKITNQLK